jgi:hypothetical protein
MNNWETVPAAASPSMGAMAAVEHSVAQIKSLIQASVIT